MANSEIIGAGQDTARPAPKKYKIIYADPPWNVRTFKEKKDGMISRELPYQRMTDKQIMELPISKIADVDSILFMWVIDNRIPFMSALFNSWGFTYKCVGFVWAKQSKTTSGFNGGFSSYTKRDCEFCFIGTRGKYLNLKRGVNQILLEPKTVHSKKPNEIRNRIVQLCGYVSRIELFARQRVDGWDAWGNEV
jgi:site-specific DNA-methyltransferase (adenine-specific)